MQDNSKRIKELLTMANKVKSNGDAEKIITASASASGGSAYAIQSSTGRDASSSKNPGQSEITKFFWKFILATVVLYGGFLILCMTVQMNDILAFAIYIAVAVVIGLLMSYNVEKYKLLRFIFSFFASALLYFAITEIVFKIQ